MWLLTICTSLDTGALDTETSKINSIVSLGRAVSWGQPDFAAMEESACALDHFDSDQNSAHTNEAVCHKLASPRHPIQGRYDLRQLLV